MGQEAGSGFLINANAKANTGVLCLGLFVHMHVIFLFVLWNQKKEVLI